MDFRRPLAVVTPTLDGDVLAALAGAADAFTGAEVHRLTGRGSESGVLRTLRRLALQGVVETRPAGRATLYALNREHLAAAHIEALAQLGHQVVQELRRLISTWDVPPEAAALFGSAARRAAGPDSDLDLLVIRPLDVGVDNPTWRDQIDELARSATKWTGNDARVLELSVAEAVTTSGAVEPVLVEAITEGTPIVGDLAALSARGRS